MIDDETANRKARVDAKMRNVQLIRISNAAAATEKHLRKLCYSMESEAVKQHLPTQHVFRWFDELRDAIDKMQSIYAMAYAASEREKVTEAVH